MVLGNGQGNSEFGKTCQEYALKILRIFGGRKFLSLENMLMGWDWPSLCLLWSHLNDVHYGRGNDRRMPSFLLQLYAGSFLSLAKKEDTFYVCVYVHAEAKRGP